MSEANILGQSLRTWRERLSPADVGMVYGSDRRTPGLRREELAALADVSVDYVVRMEQGRSRPSRAVLSALTRSLRLSRDERDHLFRLAGQEPPAADVISEYIPAGVQRLLVRLGDVAIAVFAADWTLLTWSPLWGALMGISSPRGKQSPNLLRMTFLGGRNAVTFGECAVRTLGDPRQDRADLVADLRAATGRYPRDSKLISLVAELQRNDEFAAVWKRGEVAQHDSIQKVVSHPLGEIVLDCDTMTVPGADLHVLVYTPAESSRDAELLDFIKATRLTTVADRNHP